MSQNIVVQYLQWHFIEMPKEFLRGWKNYLKFYSYFFSIPLLLKTLFSPWKRYQWSYGRGFSPTRYLETFVSNMFSRLIGAVLRITLICVGILVELFVFALGGIVFLCWLFLPAILFFTFLFGIKLLF
jgi:hypothetical protein